MNEDPLKEKIEAFYASQSLSDRSVKRIKRAGKPRAWVGFLAATAGFVVLAALVFLPIAPQSTYAVLADEIAEVHRILPDANDEPLDFTIAELQAELRLPVDLSGAEDEIARRFDILDCRACVFDGKEAVRMQVRERGTKVRGTLYVAGLTRKLARLPKLIGLGDVNVEFWNDGVRCFGFACDCDA
ncbi:MAG: hypothetical protein ACI8UO_004225 [Verrucomicrobiales bacterium]|jgi:hypothetical protein